MTATIASHLDSSIESQRQVLDALQAQLGALLETIEEMKTKSGPMLIARYQSSLGRLELQLLELQVGVQAARRRVELLQKRMNHGEAILPADIVAIDQQIKVELAQWNDNLVAQAKALDAANQFLALAVPVSDADMRRAKTAYRRLARLLHPDANPDNALLFEKYWSAIQSAYARVDVALMEALLEVVEHATVQSEVAAPDQSQIDRLRTLVYTHAETVARMSNEPPHSYARFLDDEAWVTKRQASLEGAIAAESSRLASLVIRQSELLATSTFASNATKESP